MRYAIVLDGEVREIRSYPEPPACRIIDGKPVLRPLIEPVYDAATHRPNGYTIFDDRVEIVIIPIPAAEIAAKNRVSLEGELADLEIKTARAFIWLVKKLVQKGVLTQAEIPAPLKALQTRMEQIETELAQ